MTLLTTVKKAIASDNYREIQKAFKSAREQGYTLEFVKANSCKSELIHQLNRVVDMESKDLTIVDQAQAELDAYINEQADEIALEDKDLSNHLATQDDNSELINYGGYWSSVEDYDQQEFNAKVDVEAEAEWNAYCEQIARENAELDNSEPEDSLEFYSDSERAEILNQQYMDLLKLYDSEPVSNVDVDCASFLEMTGIRATQANNVVSVKFNQGTEYLGFGRDDWQSCTPRRVSRRAARFFSHLVA